MSINKLTNEAGPRPANCSSYRIKTQRNNLTQIYLQASKKPDSYAYFFGTIATYDFHQLDIVLDDVQPLEVILLKASEYLEIQQFTSVTWHRSFSLMAIVIFLTSMLSWPNFYSPYDPSHLGWSEQCLSRTCTLSVTKWNYSTVSSFLHEKRAYIYRICSGTHCNEKGQHSSDTEPSK